MIDFINSWYVIVGIVALAVLLVTLIMNFFNIPTKEQIGKVKEWLVYACLEAEKKLGGGTGQIKLRYVYDLFVDKFTWIAKLITFEKFSELVDVALGTMEDLLKTNTSVANLINKEESKNDK